AAAGESRSGPARPDAAAGAGPDPIHDRLGVGARGDRGLGRASGGGALGGELRAPRDQPDQVRGAGSRRAQSPQDEAMGHSLPDHGGVTQRGGDPTPGGTDGLAGSGDQRPSPTAVVGGFAADLPWGLVWGTALSSVEGPAAGDSAVLRAAGRP